MVITRTNRTDKGSRPVKCLPIIISNNKGKLSKAKIRTDNSLPQTNNSKGNLNPVIHKADNKWTGRIKTVTRVHKIIIGRNSNEAAEADQVEEVAVVVAEEGNFY